MDQIVMTLVTVFLELLVLLVLIVSCQSDYNHLGSCFTDWKRIVASPLPTGKYNTEQPWHATYGEDWTMTKEEESFQLGKPWSHASVLILSHPGWSLALNPSFPLAPQEKPITQHYLFPQHLPQGMKWNSQLTFIAEIIICMSSIN